ncbi:hypothetical protein D9M71_674550 [compost metagenome]
MPSPPPVNTGRIEEFADRITPLANDIKVHQVYCSPWCEQIGQKHQYVSVENIELFLPDHCRDNAYGQGHRDDCDAPQKQRWPDPTETVNDRDQGQAASVSVERHHHQKTDEQQCDGYSTTSCHQGAATLCDRHDDGYAGGRCREQGAKANHPQR